MAFFGLIGAIVLQSQIVGTSDASSFLHKFISGDEVSEGPLSPTAYAQGTSSNGAGSRLSSVDATDANFITFSDPEVQFAQTLEGNAVVAPMQPAIDTADGSSTGSTNSSSDNSSKSQNTLSIQKPFIYTVVDGDTIAGIASKYNSYNAKAADIVSANGLQDSSKIALGQKLIIPNGDAPAGQAPRIVSQNTQTARDTGDEPTPAPQKDEVKTPSGFGWPTVSHHISQYFGHEGHTGIDIDNRSKPPVFAAQDGTVEFAGWLGAYGNLIIINHGNGLTTYYAHLTKFYVAKGADVKKGDAIAKMGSTGHSTGPHVHFEVRRFGVPINPLGMY